ncbi:hypothetical protein AD998_02020 [bacterium 336/3]|nr:hypothetical protein AD998_02020 [bacterium 336/3]
MAINGTEYAWEDIDIVLFGRIVVGVTEINYKIKRERKNIYGRGKKPVAYGRSSAEYSGSIGLLQSEIEAIQSSLPRGKNLTDIPPFDVTVSYRYENNTVIDILRSCSFTEYEKGMKTGDTNMEIKLPIDIGDIEYNA